MKKKTKKLLIFFLIFPILIIYFIYFQNNSLVTTEYFISSGNLPQNFDDYKIVQLSDLHSKSFGKEQSKLVEKVEELAPNIIVFTGDLIDSNNDEEEPSITLMEKLVQIAPVYFVTGNHEWWSGEWDSLVQKLTNLGVKVMNNTSEEIMIKDDSIQIIGIHDPANVHDSYAEKTKAEENMEKSIESLEEDQFQILLAHRPEMLSIYEKYGFDLVLTGHAHGGQFRIPFVGGLIAPNQGFFPKYTVGKHTVNETTMIINRGLGNSIIPIRIFNRPEIVTVTLSN